MKSTRILRYSIIFLLFLIQTLFLLAIFREKIHSYLILLFIASLSILMLYVYRKVDIHHPEHEVESYRIAVWVPIGAACSYYLNHRIGLGPVLAAAIIGSIASLAPQIKPSSTYYLGIPTAAYCGAFIGMSSTRVASNFAFVLIASFFTAVLLIISKSLLQGVGGKLGTLAFLGVALTYFILYLVS
ncbi:hypothetical protein [Sphingobacterium sp. MYb382]|uniref:hypothetical protein n=1 Tax=Sphingobacterium sp. MYb382 TaxID=2745278 RepID=UPI0030AE7B0B